jgi:hypothetical protein
MKNGNVEKLLKGDLKMADYIEKIENVPFLTKDYSEQIYALFKNAITELRERDRMPHITGLWFITEPTCDGGMQILVRSPIPVKTTMRLQIDGLLCDLLHHEIAYDYERDFIEGSGMVITDIDDIEFWIDEGQVLCVYDAERGEC